MNKVHSGKGSAADEASTSWSRLGRPRRRFAGRARNRARFDRRLGRRCLRWCRSDRCWNVGDSSPLRIDVHLPIALFSWNFHVDRRVFSGLGDVSTSDATSVGQIFPYSLARVWPVSARSFHALLFEPLP